MTEQYDYSSYARKLSPAANPALGARNWIVLYRLGGFAAQTIQINNFSHFSPAAGEK